MAERGSLWRAIASDEFVNIILIWQKVLKATFPEQNGSQSKSSVSDCRSVPERTFFFCSVQIVG
jgi:hypothetical protein